jgi:hypothetical protein
MSVFPLLLLFTLLLVCLVVLLELLAPGALTEGFSNLPGTSYWATFAAPRSDIAPDREDSSLVRDPRYFNDYADVTRIGQKYDFCRMVALAPTPKDLFFACALAGTEALDSTTYRTSSVSQGFRISQDDYMRDTNGDGREDYCRILKWKDGSYQAVCARAKDFSFDDREVVDPDPPEQIATLLTFYQGCVLWLRFFGDLNDTIENVTVQTAGSPRIDETPRRDTTEGLTFDGTSQFLRISDSRDLTLGFKVPIRSIRTWMVWVKFDEFTNNAKIFDFGNGAGKGNVFLGIYAKGDTETQGEDLRPLLCGEESTVPDKRSGAQPPMEMTPKHLMETTDANVNEFRCIGFETQPRRLEPSTVTPIRSRKTNKATLLYEVWDQQSRKLRIKVPAAFAKGQWTHICITATNNDAFRPDLAVYINGKLKLLKPNAFLPSTSSMSNCYIGKSNWANSVSQYENRDELFQGSLFDFRAYSVSVSEDLVVNSYDWGLAKLGLPSRDSVLPTVATTNDFTRVRPGES